MAKKTHGKTASGIPITDKLVEQLASRPTPATTWSRRYADAGGRPALGSAPASVESVRLEPELCDALLKRAKRDHETPSSVLRRALRNYLQVG